MSGIEHHKQAGLRVTAGAKTHQSWAWVQKPWILGLVLGFDLLTKSIRVGQSWGAKLLQGLILSLCLTVNSWWNPPLALGAICQGGTSRLPHNSKTTFGREQERVPSSDCAQVTWFILFCVIPSSFFTEGLLLWPKVDSPTPARSCDLSSSG